MGKTNSPPPKEIKPVFSRCCREFRKLYEDLPKHLREEADKSFSNWQKNPDSVQFKPIVVTNGQVWSARVTEKYRALATKTETNGQTKWVWFWIGTHNQYELMLKNRLNQKISQLREQYSTNTKPAKILIPAR